MSRLLTLQAILMRKPLSQLGFLKKYLGSGQAQNKSVQGIIFDRYPHLDHLFGQEGISYHLL